MPRRSSAVSTRACTSRSRERAVRDAHPQDARPLESGEGAEAVQREREGSRDGRRLDECRLDLTELHVGQLAEEPEREVEVGRGHPRDGPARWPETLDLGGHGRPHRLIQEEGDERPRHGPAFKRDDRE